MLLTVLLIVYNTATLVAASGVIIKKFYNSVKNIDAPKSWLIN